MIVPDGVRCRLDAGLINSRSGCVEIKLRRGDPSFSSLPARADSLTLKPLIYGAYTGNVAPFENIQMIGRTRDSTVGIAAARQRLRTVRYNIHGFGHGYEVHSGSWSIIL